MCYDYYMFCVSGQNARERKVKHNGNVKKTEAEEESV